VTEVAPKVRRGVTVVSSTDGYASLPGIRACVRPPATPSGLVGVVEGLLAELTRAELFSSGD
jgi:hypothetical protein